jgi:DNA-binding transcriptional LysR family regulator
VSADLVGLKSGIVSIAVLATFATAVASMATTRLQAQYPDVLVQVDILDSDKIHSLISRGNCDFDLVHLPGTSPT